MSGRQPGAIPSIRRVTDADGRRVVLSVTAGKRRNDSAVYVGRHRGTGDRVILRRTVGGWAVVALVADDSANRQYADSRRAIGDTGGRTADTGGGGDMVPVMDCGQVFYAGRPFTPEGERRRCTLPAGHAGPHGAEVERPEWARRAKRHALPVKVYR